MEFFSRVTILRIDSNNVVNIGAGVKWCPVMFIDTAALAWYNVAMEMVRHTYVQGQLPYVNR